VEKKNERNKARMRIRREDPEFKAKELEYLKSYCEKRGMKYGELWDEIYAKRGEENPIKKKVIQDTLI
jgi:hypothetical protein